MKIDGRITIHGPIEEVWALFNDPDRLCGVVPGCEEARRIDDTHFEAKLSVKVQFMSVKSHAKATITESVPPRRLVVEMVGEPVAMAGAFRTLLIIDLTSVEAGTDVSYTFDITMMGRLASLGEAIVRLTAKRLATQFTENVSKLFVPSGK